MNVVGGCGEADQIAEEHRDDLAFLTDGCWSDRAEWSRTKRTEREIAREIFAAVRTCGHGPSFTETGMFCSIPGSIVEIVAKVTSSRYTDHDA